METWLKLGRTRKITPIIVFEKTFQFLRWCPQLFFFIQTISFLNKTVASHNASNPREKLYSRKSKTKKF